MHRTIKAFVLPAAGIALGAALALPAAAQDVEWTFANNYAPTRPESAHIRDFVKNVEENTGGKLVISLSEGGAMGLKDADALRYMQIGTPTMGFIWSPFLGRDAPDVANVYVFGLVSGAEEHMKALPAVQEVLEAGIEERGIEVIGFMGLPIIQASIFCREPVQDLDALREVKLRVGTREQVETFDKLGVAAQIVPQNELYSALQTGVIDCALYPARFAHTVSLQEVAEHATPVGFPFPPTPYAIMVHKASWDGLPDDLKSGVMTAMDTLQEASFDFAKDVEAEAAARKSTAEMGVTWYDGFSAEDQAAIREAALETWAALAQEAGGNAPAYREKVLQALQ
ncbi:MAG: TRAP transporter substrate-binding protein DctP [Pseudomonadota bacterium]